MMMVKFVSLQTEEKKVYQKVLRTFARFIIVVCIKQYSLIGKMR